MTQLLHNLVEPTPVFDLQAHTHEGKTFLILQIQATPGTFYCLFPDRPEFYYRRGASTFRAGREDIASVLRPADPAPLASVLRAY